MAGLIRWRPYGSVGTLQNEMNDLFERFLGRDFPGAAGDAAALAFTPPVNVSETADNIVVSCEVPGMDPKDIDISVAGNTLTLRGERKQEKEEKDETWHRVERVYGQFQRSFQLPASVVMDKVSADYRNGVLRVTLPKTDESRRREVKIRVS